jgi:hypothetical protein
MTAQELNDNYEYKITKRALIKEFPFIKDVFVREEEEDCDDCEDEDCEDEE